MTRLMGMVLAVASAASATRSGLRLEWVVLAVRAGLPVAAHLSDSVIAQSGSHMLHIVTTAMV